MEKEVNVLPIQNYETKTWIMNRHYAKRMPSISYAFGLFDNSEMIGICTFGSPPSPALCVGVCGVKHKSKVVELNRLILETDKPNSASFLVSQSLNLLPKPSIVVSYADTKQGHVGYIYQATNFLYTGLSEPRLDWAIKGLEHKHSKTISDGMTLEDMKEKYGDRFYHVQRDRKHRYIFFTGSRLQKKRLMKLLKYKISTYPKGESKKYDASGYVETQYAMEF
tara:strand:- start:307 stop:975 length:669 start_codon:yes stop_codon:yes gene_type:complete